MEYKFDNSLDKNGNKKHIHTLGGKKLTGCTTILNIVAKPNLIQWAADMAVSRFGWIKAEEWIEENGKAKKIEVPRELRLEKAKVGLDGILKLDLEKYLDALDNARVEHCKKKEKAGDYGTKTHEEIENLVLNAIKNNNGIVSGTSDNKSIQNFIDWSTENKVKFLESEKNIYSESLWIGGIVDLVVEIDGQIWIGDVKTSKSGIYAENFWQCAGYQLMLNSMNLYLDIAGYLILNLKENGEMLEKRSISNKDNIKAFLSCLNIYRIQEKIKNQIL